MKSGFVSLIGRPNAGKSTLLNRLVGTKLAIVSDKPQTTRTRILGVRNYPDAQVVFLDTPGIHRPLHRMNVRMVDAAVETLREVDAVMLVHDASTRPGHGDQFVSKLLTDITNRFECDIHHADVHPVERAMDAGGVEEHHLRVGVMSHTEDSRPRRLRLVGDDRQLGADQPVEQRRLARVRAADEGDKA